MRQKRAKAYRKLMHLYGQFFGFRQPYQLLVDPETCKMAIANKIDLWKQLSTVTQGEVKPMITQCCIHSLYLKGKSEQEAVDLAKTFERRKCNHREAIDPDDCLKDVVGKTNKHRYLIVTQSVPLRNILRNIAATPIIHINRSVMVLEPPSSATIRAKQKSEDKVLRASGSDLTLVEATTSKEPPRKKKGPKGPNPLSVKKKKPQPIQTSKAFTKTDKERADSGKRKREVDDNTERGNGSSVEGSTTLVDTGTDSRKRKRRRKAKQADGDTRGESAITAPHD